MTERQTNASSGSVVNMFRPKQLVEISQKFHIKINGKIVQSCDVDNDIV